MFSAGKRALRSRLVAVAIGALVMAGAGGVAWATIPGPDGVIHGCYQKENGQLRVIDPTNAGDKNSSACKENEQPLDWNQRGAPGAPGPQGPQGDRGPSDAFTTYGGDYVPLAPTQQRYAQLQLGPGNYIVTASLWVGNDLGPSTGVTASCKFTGGGAAPAPYQANTSAKYPAPGWAAALSFTGPATFGPGGGTVGLDCVGLTSDTSSGAAGAHLHDVRLTAIQVATITTQ